MLQVAVNQENFVLNKFIAIFATPICVGIANF